MQVKPIKPDCSETPSSRCRNQQHPTCFEPEPSNGWALDPTHCNCKISGVTSSALGARLRLDVRLDSLRFDPVRLFIATVCVAAHGAFEVPAHKPPARSFNTVLGPMPESRSDKCSSDSNGPRVRSTIIRCAVFAPMPLICSSSCALARLTSMPAKLALLAKSNTAALAYLSTHLNTHLSTYLSLRLGTHLDPQPTVARKDIRWCGRGQLICMVSLRLTKATSCPLCNIKSITANTHMRATIRWLLMVVGAGAVMGAVVSAVVGTDGYCSMGTACTTHHCCVARAVSTAPMRQTQSGSAHSQPHPFARL